MSRDSGEEIDILENADEVIENLSKELQDLYLYRDLFFENHPIKMALDKNKLVEEKKEELVKKLEEIDVDKQIPFPLRAQFLYLKGRCYNINPAYDSRATQCLSKAVKLNPHLVDAWNELGECYWKNANIKEAKASFEGALKHERNRLALRCLSIILRQESGAKKPKEATTAIVQSVELAKEAVAQDIKDGVSWTVLGNAYLCQFFMVSQDPGVLKACLSAYRQAWLDPIAKGQPDLYYNKGIALKYEEDYLEALQNFEYACSLDPLWEPPRLELGRLTTYLTNTNSLVQTRGKMKVKKLTQMVQAKFPLKTVTGWALTSQEKVDTFTQQLVKVFATNISSNAHGKSILLPNSYIVCAKIRKSLEEKQYCSSVFLDIQQAFDKVWHRLKINRTQQYFSLLKSYLSERLFQSIDMKMLGAYGPNTLHSFGTRSDVKLERVKLGCLQEGTNEGKVVLAKVVGSIHSENAVPFTFAVVDESMESVCVTVYNWADGRGAIIGDCVCIPEPKLTLHKYDKQTLKYEFKSIRLNSPMHLLLNGKRVSRDQFACTKATSTYEIH
ncbi:unnamed protein product [Diatraea saccharalis]|uniref:Tetratricopeptide repeat protein 5 OB fold domain-containing protein n=1 Tax=Diatraea saccharalis TaxID=40085 RepID=A0A9N9N1J3_9NEOP|nr:unnamed protein product [Diatraea saccharalis]